MINLVAEIGSTWIRNNLMDSKQSLLWSIKEAANSGATTVKVQLGLSGLYSQTRAPRQWQACQAQEVPAEWWPELRWMADQSHVALTASVFDPRLFDRLDINKFHGFKLASGELTPNSKALIQTAAAYCADNRKGVALSTGAATDAMIEQTLNLLAPYPLPELTLYNCVSEYPAKPESYNLAALFKYRPGTLSPEATMITGIGLSDHTTGSVLVYRAIETGYTHFEKHFRLEDCSILNPDYPHSLPLDMFWRNRLAIREAAVQWLEQPKQVTPGEMGEVQWMQRGSVGLRPREDAE